MCVETAPSPVRQQGHERDCAANALWKVFQDYFLKQSYSRYQRRFWTLLIRMVSNMTNVASYVFNYRHVLAIKLVLRLV